VVEQFPRVAEYSALQPNGVHLKTDLKNDLAFGAYLIEVKSAASQRIHECKCGVKVKRDVLSAFLARRVTDDYLIMSSILDDWGRLETMLLQAFRSSKLRASRRCRTQEMSVFLGAILPEFLHEPRESKIVDQAKPCELKNPRCEKSGESQYCIS
jgi:hypothetical protein